MLSCAPVSKRIACGSDTEWSFQVPCVLVAGISQILPTLICVVVSHLRLR